jgi:hypothetical protein
MSRTKITADIPADATKERRTAIVAGAYQAALSIASSDPEVRLRMILGEAYQRYSEVFVWMAREIAKDEERAPGLIALAKTWSSDRRPLLVGYPDFMAEAIGAVQQMLIEDAAVLLREKPLVVALPPAEPIADG